MSLLDGLVSATNMDNDWLDSANSNDGTPTGATFTSPGKIFANAGFFDGIDDYVTLANESNFDITDYLTISTWVQRNGATGVPQGIVTKTTFAAGDRGYGLVVDNNGADTISMFVAESVGNTLIKYVPLAAGFNHVIGIFDKDQSGTNKIKVYINGSDIGTTLSAGSISTIGTNNNSVRFGERAGGGYPAKITANQALIYDRVLSPSEVSELYNGGAGLDIFATAAGRTLMLMGI